MTILNINRDIMESALIADDMTNIIGMGPKTMLELILLNGFKGYANQTEGELFCEIRERGIDITKYL